MNSADFRRGSVWSLLPVLGLAAAWCAVWMVWPARGPSSAARTGSVSAPRYLFLPRGGGSSWSLPSVPFPLPSEHGFSGALRDDRTGPESLKPVRTDLASTLKRSASRGGEATPASAIDLSAGIGMLGSYQPPAVMEPFDGTGGEVAMRIRLEVTEGLAKTRPSMAGSLGEKELMTAEPWSAEAHVEVAADGRVQHVFLETPTRNPALNSLLVRALYRSRSTNVVEACEGQVLLSWPGKQPLESSP